MQDKGDFDSSRLFWQFFCKMTRIMRATFIFFFGYCRVVLGFDVTEVGGGIEIEGGTVGTYYSGLVVTGPVIINIPCTPYQAW